MRMINLPSSIALGMIALSGPALAAATSNDRLDIDIVATQLDNSSPRFTAPTPTAEFAEDTVSFFPPNFGETPKKDGQEQEIASLGF